MTVDPRGMAARKRRHIDVCLTDAVGYHGVTTGLLLGNIGLSQWSKPAAPDIAKALGRVGADDLAVHTNPLQEADQHNGDTDFSGPFARLRDVVGKLRYPTLLKEVGHGIGARGSLVASGGNPHRLGCGEGDRICANVVAVARPLLAGRWNPLPARSIDCIALSKSCGSARPAGAHPNCQPCARSV